MLRVVLTTLAVSAMASIDIYAPTSNDNGEIHLKIANNIVKVTGIVKDPNQPFYAQFRVPYLSQSLTLSVPYMHTFVSPATSINGKCISEDKSIAIGVPLTGKEATLECPWVYGEWFISINTPPTASKVKNVAISLEVRIGSQKSYLSFPAPSGEDGSKYYFKVAICVFLVVSISVMTGVMFAIVQKRRADLLRARANQELEGRWLGYNQMPNDAAPPQTYICPHGRVHTVLPLQQAVCTSS
jgi:hypothetical protein